jgi:hypothetical protein
LSFELVNYWGAWGLRLGNLEVFLSWGLFLASLCIIGFSQRCSGLPFGETTSKMQSNLGYDA